jgi:small ligand-binding sensory domain FIST
VTRFASALSRHPVVTDAAGEVAGSLLEQLGGEEPDLLVTFASPHFVGAFEDVVATLRQVLSPGLTLGATMGSVIGEGEEVEDAPAIAAFAASLPGGRLTATTLHSPDGREIVGWPDDLGTASTLLLLADPFTFPVDGLLHAIDHQQPGLSVIGGLASAAMQPGGNRIAVDDRILPTGAVGALLDGVAVTTVVSQGCRPIGQPFVVTRSERNLVEELAGRPPLERLQDLAVAASEEERELLRHGLHVGIVVDEHRSDFGRGDFLVRNVVGADPDSGALAVGAAVDVGQTIQFHVRDAAAADEDLRALLAGASAAAALVFTCNGRGRQLFGVADHDAGVVQQLLGPLPAAGGFCAGEIGPVGGRNFLHGFTASLALFS